MTDDSPLVGLVRDARDGRADAWDELVERYTPLVLAVVRRHRLQGSDGDDVVATLWLRLVEHLGDIRDPRALPGWIVTTARHECLRTLRQHQRTQPWDPLDPVGGLDGPSPVSSGGTQDVALDDRVVDQMTDAARHEALLRAFAELPATQRRLLLVLMTDPPLSYAEVSARLGMPIGSIGPLRARALQRIRAHPAVAACMAASRPDTQERARS